VMGHSTESTDGRGKQNFPIALASNEILRGRTLFASPIGSARVFRRFAVFSDHRANVNPVSPSNWTLLCLSKVLTRIRDEREVRGRYAARLSSVRTASSQDRWTWFNEKYLLAEYPATVRAGLR
jgi:hypothetical protein